ncbi:hypothetical protein KTD31_02320 [Burkholderia multivorans]|uniref:hypothetical protein n=1 Tax=Burkholderia multivorans TaxID=87883 RepID=UPI001C238AEB|nr:hypothetical protein [Burkholderia multivorans]MBU9200240.1 hypothetical protein [Burkholderia multivorans]MDN8078633.1 hypothetical protein [Burkholderia multivorans]
MPYMLYLRGATQITEAMLEHLHGLPGLNLVRVRTHIIVVDFIGSEQELRAHLADTTWHVARGHPRTYSLR